MAGSDPFKMSCLITSYDPLDPSQCGKQAGDPNIGIGAAGSRCEAGKTCAVDSSLIPMGSFVYVPDWGWVTANDTGAFSGPHIDLAASTSQPWPGGSTSGVECIVYPPGSSVDTSCAPDSSALPVLDGGPLGGAGASASPSSKKNKSTPKGILKFAGFIASLSFQESLKSGFEAASEYSLHQFLAGFMDKFYHNIYYVPTLPNNKCIVVKPETMFIDPPTCNVIYPSMRSSGGYTRNYKSEPTRIILVSDPVAKLFGASEGVQNDLSNVVTIAYIDYADSTKYALTVKGLKQLTGETADLSKPMGMISTYEKDSGVRILRSNKGADLFLFLMSEKDGNSVKSGSGTVKAKVINKDGRDLKDVADVLFKLASYTLQRARYECRPGSYQCYFNPYLVPGFPMLNIETDSPDTNLSVHAYVTDVTHQITDNGWTTSISTSATHRLPDPKPEAFPIVEQEYTEGIDATYTNMLGPSCTRIDYDTAIHSSAAKYANSGKTATEAYKAIWRPLTTMAEHLDKVCDGAKPQYTENGIMVLQGSFFDASAQLKLIDYSTRILNGLANNASDVY